MRQCWQLRHMLPARRVGGTAPRWPVACARGLRACARQLPQAPCWGASRARGRRDLTIRAHEGLERATVELACHAAIAVASMLGPAGCNPRPSPQSGLARAQWRRWHARTLRRVTSAARSAREQFTLTSTLGSPADAPPWWLPRARPRLRSGHDDRPSVPGRPQGRAPGFRNCRIRPRPVWP